MSDKAVVTGSSTLGESLKEVAVGTPTPTETVVTDNQPSTTVVTETGNLESNIPVPEVQPQQTEDNVDNFELSFAEDAPTEQQPNQPQQQTQSDWRNTIRSVDRKELLKELGITEFAEEINNHILKGGKASDYITAKGINWDEVPDLDLVRADFDKKYQHLTKEQKAYLFNKKFVSNPDSDSEEDVMGKDIELKIAANEIRQREKANSASFKMPEPMQLEGNEEYENWKEQQTQINEHRNKFKSYLDNHEATKNLLQNKRVAIKVDEKGNAFNFGIDKPEAILNALTDGGKTWMKLMQNAQGEPDIAKQQLVILFASNPEKFVGKIFNYGKMQGVKEKVTENNYVAPINGTQPRNSVTTNERDVWKNARNSTLGGN